ncbi:hypothetical protein ACVPPR_07340 [Dellaglioa sp. L3N]
MKKYEIKMADVNSKIRTVIQSTNIEEEYEFINKLAGKMQHGEVIKSELNGNIINLKNIVEITSIEEVKE